MNDIVTICKIHGEIKTKNAKKINRKNWKGYRCRKCVNIQRCKSYLNKNREKIRERERKRANALSFKEKRKNNLLKRQFNITLEDYKKMLSNQNYVCKICKNSDPIRNLAVDHCHKTNKVRGLLCYKCNTSLGHFNDSIEILESAIEYLKTTSQ